jgi:hypothetical protein
MEEIKFCDECKKENCEKRIKGGICSLNKEVGEFCKTLNTRDPFLLANGMLKIVDSENDRYKKAVQHEGVGEKEISYVVDKNGRMKKIEKIKGLDSRISSLALNILKGGKIVNEIMNPQKNPLFQQNNQYNVSVGSADEINSLPKEEREKVLKFIDKRLDDERKNS